MQRRMPVESGWVCTNAADQNSVCTRSCFGVIGNECQGIDCCASPFVRGGTFTLGNGIEQFSVDPLGLPTGQGRSDSRSVPKIRGSYES